MSYIIEGPMGVNDATVQNPSAFFRPVVIGFLLMARALKLTTQSGIAVLGYYSVSVPVPNGDARVPLKHRAFLSPYHKEQGISCPF